MNAPFLHHDGLSRRLPAPRLRHLSLGAGVQSTTLALMAKHGEIEMPDHAIFADTGDEPIAVYEHLNWLISVLPFPVHIVRCGRGLREALQAGDEDGARIPFHVGAGGMGGRNCTRDWKIRPIRAKVRELLGAGPRSYIEPDADEQWIGISLDEITRIKPSGVRFMHNRHPLVEARMTRRDCYRWLEDRQYRIPPKSRCKYCPYQGNADWLDLQGRPDEWTEVVDLDGWLRQPAQVKRFHGEVFLHSSRRPLAAVDLSRPDPAPDLFGHECEGMCGV